MKLIKSAGTMHLMKSEDLIEMNGTVRSVIYYNEENHYAIVAIDGGDFGYDFTARGNLIKVQVGETLRLSGHWKMDAKYGRQFLVKYFQVITPQTIEGVRKYLGSGLIPGIGEGFATRLVEAFGAETLEVIEKQPERLGEVEGLGKKRIQSILQGWKEQKVVRDVMIFLRERGISDGMAHKIYNQYGYQALEKIQNDPFRLVREVQGVGFVTADRIAREQGMEEDSQERCRAGLVHLLNEGLVQGNCYLPEKELKARTMELLEVGREALSLGYEKAILEQDLVQEEERVYLPMIHRIEDQVALRLVTLLKTEEKSVPYIDQNSSRVQSLIPDFALSEEQEESIEHALSTKLSIITGGPGVGKTTVLSTLVRIFEDFGCDVVLCSPTGKASRRMEEATGHKASTIHKLLKYGGGGFEKDEMDPLEGDVFILDEVSMMDLYLFHAFLKAVPLEASLILVGDVDQLPSVGPGRILADLIESSLIQLTRLHKIFRQEGQSDIVVNAHRVNEGKWFNPVQGADFFYVPTTNVQKSQELLQKMLLERIPRKFGLNPVLDVQVLIPMYRSESGIERFNELMQDWLNPSEASFEIRGKKFREGDKVMQLANNYDLEVFNGDHGIIEAIDRSSNSIRVRFDKHRTVVYEKKALEDLTLSYASSIHKVQGSEFPCVVVVLHRAHSNLLQRSLLYTAMTRGKKLVILMGEKVAYERAIARLDERKRFTTLKERIHHWFEFSE